MTADVQRVLVTLGFVLVLKRLPQNKHSYCFSASWALDDDGQSMFVQGGYVGRQWQLFTAAQKNERGASYATRQGQARTYRGFTYLRSSALSNFFGFLGQHSHMREAL